MPIIILFQISQFDPCKITRNEKLFLEISLKPAKTSWPFKLKTAYDLLRQHDVSFDTIKLNNSAA